MIPPPVQGRLVLVPRYAAPCRRLGSPNFHNLPINAPKCPFANHQRDGHMQTTRPKGRVAYEPSSLQADSPREAVHGFRSAPVTESGERGRVRAEAFADHYTQARLFYRSQTTHEKAHIASALVFELSKVEEPHVRQAIVGHLRNVDEPLGKRVADGLGLDNLPAAPAPAAPILDMPLSPALQILGKMKDTLEGRAVGILIAEGSDAKAIAAVSRAVTAAGATVKIVAPKVGGTKLSRIEVRRCPPTANWRALPR